MRRVPAVLAGAAAVIALGAGPAAAHDEFVGSTPTDGATVDAAPGQVVLTFTEPAVALGTRMLVTGPDGATVTEGEARLVGSTVVQALVPTRSAGTYHVDWRVTSADGHPVSGSFTFTATNPTPAPATATVPAPGTTEPTPSATTALPPGTTVSSTPVPSRNTVIGIVVLVVLALVVVRIGRARSLRRLTAQHEARGSDAGTGGGA